MNIVKASFKQKRLIYFMLFSLLVSGVAAFKILGKLEDPELKIKSALIITPFPGASAEEVEESVSKTLENHIRTIPNIKEVTSRSLANYSEINVSLKTTVPEKDVDQYWDFLRKKVHDAKASLPNGAYEPQVYDDFGDVYGLFYAMASDGYDYDEMREYSKVVRDRLLAIDGVKRVSLNGNQKTVIDLSIDVDQLSHLGIMPTAIVSTIENQLNTVYAGAYLTEDNNIRVAVPKRLKDISQLENIMITGTHDMQYRLKDIATIARKVEEPFSSRMYYNQSPAIGISVSMNPGENIVEIGKQVEAQIEILKEELPLGISFHKVYFQSDLVKSALSKFMWNLAASVIIVIGILLLVMGWRSGVVIGTSLVLAIVGAFPFLLIFGGTIQRVSLGAFIIAMGMLVDNAIVVIDGIYDDLKRGVPRMEAMSRSPQQRAWALFAATLIAILSFLPVYLSPDTTGVYTRDLFLVLASSLLLSWFLAIFQVPLMATNFLKISKKAKEKRGGFSDKFRQFLDQALSYPKTVICISLVLLLLSIWGSRFMKQEFFPNMEYSQNYLTYKLPEGTQPKRVEKELNEITAWLLKQDGVNNVTANIGGAATRYTLVRLMPDMSSSYGELIIKYNTIDDVEVLQDRIESYVHDHYPDAISEIKSYALISVEGLVEVNFSGDNIAVLKALADSTETIFKQSLHANSYSVRNNWERKTPYLDVNYRQLDGTSYGMTRQDASVAMMMGTSGVPIHRYFEGDTEIPIKLKMTDIGGQQMSCFKNIPVWGQSSLHLPISEVLAGDMPLDEVEEHLLEPTPLSAFADLSIQWEEPLIRRIDGVRTIKVLCNPKKGATASEIMIDVKAQVEALTLPHGVKMEWEGEQGDQANAMKYIILFIPLALFGILMILIQQYRSYRKLLITGFCVLLALIGVVPSMLITGKAFGFLAIVGVVGLAGMMIKNAVILFEEIDVQIEIQPNKRVALLDASVSRVRPVMMGALTTILGMIPLVGDVFFGSLAVTIMGGLFIGTVITLVVLPVLYVLMFK
ncbi:efflux RND transporter permease subunit [Halosquirtibacter xylanolyticus]|uniref:efflux RND transporter permease subunit n=1 Tax=Halosquirtibacter xylanolyticus TaxID=3374599 RepID=UPI003748E55E|nr:efflux RND transporter permease subunit [Prolixibacteraceae bacterium]